MQFLIDEFLNRDEISYKHICQSEGTQAVSLNAHSDLGTVIVLTQELSNNSCFCFCFCFFFFESWVPGMVRSST